MNQTNSLKVGDTLSREEISQLLGGNYQHYLPNTNGRIVAGCFDLVRNPKAPKEVLVGSGKRIVACAKLFGEQNSPVPIFIKRESKKWEYIGNYKAVKFSTDPNDVIPREIEAYGINDNKLFGVIFLDKEE